MFSDAVISNARSMKKYYLEEVPPEFRLNYFGPPVHSVFDTEEMQMVGYLQGSLYAEPIE